ncbi:MAG: methionyl-tRNA formyltransferase, partial [Caldimonas sp.]
FAGTPEFARSALDRLHAAGHEVVLVLAQPDRPAGRGMKLNAAPVKAFALEHGMNVAQPRSLRLDGKFVADAQAAQAALDAAHPDVMIVAAYGLLLPQWTLDLPPHGCLNIHASLLPRWRGAAPIQRAIEAGDDTTGVTLMQMDAGLDTGAMLLAEQVAIADDDTAATLLARLSECGALLVVRALAELAQGGFAGRAQPEAGVTYAHKIDKAEAVIDWRESAVATERRLRAFDPFPGARSTLDGDVITCWRGIARPGRGGVPGEVLAVGDVLSVACGEGSIDLVELQRAGGRRLPAADFLRGRAPQVGAVFEARATAV